MKLSRLNPTRIKILIGTYIALGLISTGERILEAASETKKKAKNKIEKKKHSRSVE